jgi:hypothetical protein
MGKDSERESLRWHKLFDLVEERRRGFSCIHVMDREGDMYDSLARASVITSPPYPNRVSYVRELRPYMYRLGCLPDGRSAGELDWQAIGGTWGCATSKLTHWTPARPLEIPYAQFQPIVERIGDHSPLLARYVSKSWAKATRGGIVVPATTRPLWSPARACGFRGVARPVAFCVKSCEAGELRPNERLR